MFQSIIRFGRNDLLSKNLNNYCNQLQFLSCLNLSTQNSTLILQENKKPLYNFTQKADRHFNTNRFKHPTTWRKRRGGSWDEDLTPENTQFLKTVIEDRYSESPLKEGPWKKGEFNPETLNKRIGVLAIKLGSIPQWTKKGRRIYTTLLQVLDNHVIDYVPPEILIDKSEKLKKRTKDGRLGMAIVGALSSDPRLYTSQYLDLFKNAGVPPKRRLTKFMITTNSVVQPGTPLYASHFRVGDYVDVGATSMGYGFQGVMKRWGFHGGPRSHGTTKFHRKRGTIGSGRQRRPIRGMKMAGHMGHRWKEHRGLKIWRINTKENILYVHSANLPGPNHCYVRIVDSCLPKARHRADNHPPFPTFYMDDIKEPLAENILDPLLFDFKDSTISFEGVDTKKRVLKREGAKLAKSKA